MNYLIKTIVQPFKVALLLVILPFYLIYQILKNVI